MGLTWTLTSFTLLADLHWYKHDSITLGKIGWQKLNNGGRSCSFNKKEIVDWTFCLAVSVYDVLLLVEQSREPLAKVHLWTWNIKAKPFLLHFYFKILFTSFINILFKKKNIFYLPTNTHHPELNRRHWH